VTLSYHQRQPKASSPQTASTAIFADVPIPHGDRS
jgi:hypothetical protein